MVSRSFSRITLIFSVTVLLFSLFLSGCGGKQISGLTLPQERDQAALIKQYLVAVDAAKYPNESKVRRLTPIVEDDKRFVWNEKGQILVANFTKKSYFTAAEYKKGYAFDLYGDTWFSTAPVMQKACATFEKEKLLLRTQQMLGMPPKVAKAATKTTDAIKVNDAFLQLWIDPSELFRPCPTLSLDQDHCNPSSATLKKNPDITPANPQPWQCEGLPTKSTNEWLCNWWDVSYEKEGWVNKFPWTALGYTYNWANMENPQGPDELVAYKGKAVVFDSVIALEEYCK